MSILVIAEHDNNELKGSTLNTVTAASEIGGDVSVLVVGSDSSSVAEQVSKISGINSVIHVDDPIYKNFLAEDLGNLVVSVADGFDYILAPATTFGKNFLPRVAAKLDVQQISDIISVEDADTFKRPIYAGSCIATVKSTDTVKAVSSGSVLFGTIFSNCSFEHNLSDIGTHIRPLPFLAIKLIFEESIVWAAVIKSPSFSLFSSSTTIIISPLLIDSIASSILSNMISVIFLFY